MSAVHRRAEIYIEVTVNFATVLSTFVLCGLTGSKHLWHFRSTQILEFTSHYCTKERLVSGRLTKGECGVVLETV